ESFLFTRGPLVEAYDEVLDAPVPARIVNLLRTRPRPASLLDWLNPARWPRFRFRAPVFAVAALAAVTLVAWLMNYAARNDFIAPDRQGVGVPAALHWGRGAPPMRASAPLANTEVVLEPQLTFY